MAKIDHIRDLSDERISIFRSLKGKDLAGKGIFIAEGEKVVLKLLESECEIVSGLMTEAWFRKLRGTFGKRTAGDVPIFLMSRGRIEEIVGFKLHQGLMIAAKEPRRPTLREASKSWRSPHLILALNALKDSENVGMIVRNAAAFGVDALIVDRQTVHPYLRRPVRVSMGAVMDVPVISVDRLPDALRWLTRNCGTRIIVTSPHAKARGIDTVSFKGNICLVLGSEGRGVSRAVTSAADLVVAIPMSGPVDSLNVASASAILLYQCSKGRLKAGSK